MPHLWVIDDGKRLRLFKHRKKALEETAALGKYLRMEPVGHREDGTADHSIVYYTDRKSLLFYPQTIEGTQLGMFTEHNDEKTTMWCVHYSLTSRVALFFNKESAVAHIEKNRGPCESISTHGSEIVFHYKTNYNVRMYPADVILTDV